MAVKFLDEPTKAVFLEEEEPDAVAAVVAGASQEPDPISGAISGSDPIPPPEPIPDVAPENRARVDADVAAAQAVMGAQMLPYRVDAFDALTQPERSQQVAQASVDAGAAKAKMEAMPLDPFSESRADAEYDFQQKQKRASALDARYQAASPMGVSQQARATSEAATTAENEKLRAEINAGPNAPNALDTFMSRIVGSISDQASALLRTGGVEPGGFSGAAQELAATGEGTLNDAARGTADAASLLLGNPAGKVGLAFAALRGANQTREDVLRRTGSPTEADKAAVQTFPALGLYMVGGMLGGRMGSAMTAANAAPFTKGAAGFAGAMVGNITPSMAMRIAEGEDYGVEALSADTLMSLFHFHNEYKGAVSERAQKRAEAELLSRGFSEQQIRQGYEEGGFRMRTDTPAALVAPLEVQIDLRAKVMVEEAQAGAKKILNENPPPSQQPREAPGKAPDAPPPAPEGGAQPQGAAAGIVPAIRVGDEVVFGRQGDTHQDILNRFIKENPDAEADAMMNFDTKENPNFFAGPDEAPISREQLQEQFGVKDSQGLRELQAAGPERRLGPGAANIEEFPPLRKIGAYNAAVDAQRAERGLSPIMSEARKADPVTWEATEQRIEADPSLPARLVEEINSGEKTSVSDVEQSALLWQMADLRTKREGELQRWNDENASPEERAQAKTDYDSIEKQLQRTEEADRKSGTMQGRALRIRRMLINEDHTFGGMMGRAQMAKGEKLTPQETQQIKQQADQYSKADKAFEERQRKLEEEQPVDQAIKDIEAEASKNPDFTPEVRSLADRIVSRLDQAASAALRRLRSKFAQSNIGADPSILADLVIYGSAKIAKGFVKFGRWAAEMVKDMGDGVKPYLQDAWTGANRNIDAEVQAMGGKNKAKVKDAVTKTPAVSKAEEIGASIKARVDGGEKLGDLTGSIQRLVETLVRGGIKTRDPLVDAVHDVLQKIDPKITRRDAMDAISGYGSFKPLNKEAVKAEVRDLRQQLQQAAKIEDLKAGVPLKKTGMERQPPSDEGRSLIKQVNELARTLGVQVTDPATQLKTVLGAIETRLTNRISDLKAEIASGARVVKGKTPAPSNDKIEALRKELASVEAEHEAAFGKRQMTDEQRLKAAIASAKRTEQTEAIRLEKAKRGVFEKPISKPEMRSAELDAIKSRTEAAREERKSLEALDNPPLSKAQKQLDAALVARERWDQVLAGEIAPAKKLPAEALSELEADARAEIAAMRELAAEIRRDAKPKTDPDAAKETAAVKALEKAAAEYERRLSEADFSAKGKKQGPDTARVAQARALRDAAKTAYDAALKLTKPVRTKEEIAIQAFKASAARRIADLQDRIAKGDFTDRPKKVPIDLSRDPQAVRAKAQMEGIKKEFQKRQFAWKQAQRPLIKKVLDAAKEVLASSRTLITSADLSAPFRQGGVLSIGDLVFNPKRFGKQFVGMLRSAITEKGFGEQEAALRLRPNADLYQKSGLYLADMDGSFTSREENMRSNLAEQIPIAGRIVRGSNRAYAGFLNRQRADAMDTFVDMMGGKGKVSAEDAQFLAKAINDLTGRGEVGGQYVGAMNFLSRYLFSPRFLISRIKTLLGAPIFRGITEGKVSMKARGVVALQYAKFAAGLTVLYGLAKLAGATVEDDPRSSDFGKIRAGNTRLDPMAGLQQAAVLISRAASGKQVDSSGKVRPITASTFGNFLRSKLAPIPGAGINLAVGKNVVGEKSTLGSEATRLVVPMSYQDAPDVYEEHGASKGTLMQFLNLLGVGLQHYGR